MPPTAPHRSPYRRLTSPSHATARGKAEQADTAAKHARSDSEVARIVSMKFAPEFHQPGTEFLKRKFPSSRNSGDFGRDDPHRLRTNTSDWSNTDELHLSPPSEPSPSAFLDLFRNNPDRRPSAAFLRRPSTAGPRRPSTVVELSLIPSLPEQVNPDYYRADKLQTPTDPREHRPPSEDYGPWDYLRPDQSYHRPDQNAGSNYYPAGRQDQNARTNYYPAGRQDQNAGTNYYPAGRQDQNAGTNYYRADQPASRQDLPARANYYRAEQSKYQGQPISLQQVTDDHEAHYYELKAEPKKAKRPAVDLSELSAIYGIPLTRPLMEDGEDAMFVPQRRSTLPVLADQTEGTDALARTSSLYGGGGGSARAKAEAQGMGTRKKSLPDITQAEGNVLSREAIAVLSSQRREAIRRQEEEAQRLRANPLLYLVSPEVWDWLASQQLVILIIVINAAIGFVFFKVIL